MMLGRGALFDHSYVDGELAIRDIGRADTSVAGDALSVCAKLATTYAASWPPKLVIYRDTRGTWNGIELDAEGRFARLYPIEEIDIAHALEKARAHERGRR